MANFQGTPWSGLLSLFDGQIVQWKGFRLRAQRKASWVQNTAILSCFAVQRIGTVILSADVLCSISSSTTLIHRMQSHAAYCSRDLRRS
jgi:hypothetical protein